MKRILFDLTVCQPMKDSKFHGGGVYGYIVLRALLQEAPDRLVIYADLNRFIVQDVLNLINEKSVEVVDKNKSSLVECIKAYSIEVFYSPLYNSSYKMLENLPLSIIITIHGLRNLEMNRDRTEVLYGRSLRDKIKALLKQTPYYNKLLKKYWEEKKWLFENDNVHIITVSKHSRESILYYYPFADKEKIHVMYSVSTAPKGYENVKPYSNEKYYLIVSANRWLKNAYRAIKAFDILFSNPQSEIDGKVIVLGLSKDSTIYNRICNKNRFELKGYVDQNELESLYKGAYALVYPTLNEGFGYPPLEAMKYGTPVIASPFASVTEVCGDAVLYANPYSSEEIAFRVLEFENDASHEKYSKRSLERYAEVESWQLHSLHSLIQFLLK